MLSRASNVSLHMTAGFLLLCSFDSQGQINTGRIAGTVSDPSGASIADVVLRAISHETGVVTTTKSSSAGDYLINFLVPGSYRLEAEKPGFQTSVEPNVTVNAGGITHSDIDMRVGEVRQTVQVASSVVAVETETSELSQTFTHKQLDALPNIDRNPLYQMNLMPGANNGRGSGNYGANGGENGSAIANSRNQIASIGGVDANANSVFIEGTFNREPQNAYVGIVPSIEAIAEVQIYTGKYNAEYGFSGSAVVNVVTKSGTNEYHGSLFEYLRNNAPDAKPFFSQSKTPFQRNQFGGAIGGPIRKNKLFFFADYQGTYFNTAGAGFTTVPTDKMYKGDFSELLDASQRDAAGNPFGQIYDPFTRKFDSTGNVTFAQPFPGNIIPTSRFDPVAAKMNDDAYGGARIYRHRQQPLLHHRGAAKRSPGGWPPGLQLIREGPLLLPLFRHEIGARQLDQHQPVLPGRQCGFRQLQPEHAFNEHAHVQPHQDERDSPGVQSHQRHYQRKEHGQRLEQLLRSEERKSGRSDYARIWWSSAASILSTTSEIPTGWRSLSGTPSH